MPIPGQKFPQQSGDANMLPASKVVPGSRSNQPVPKHATNAITNRGGTGLLRKLTDEQRKNIIPMVVDAPKQTRVVARHRIAPALQQFAIPLDQLVPDPMNARVHGDDNMEAIVASLTQYGQVTPIVVQEGTNIIIAGNGRYFAAKSMGWPDIAVHFVAMSKVEATGFGLADNKTAELAKWDLKQVKINDMLLVEAGHRNIGWTEDMLLVLRAANWIEPAIDPNAKFGEEKDEEWYTPVEYVEAARRVMGEIDLDPASCDKAQEVVKATEYYTKEMNGLDMGWGGRVWLNPPFTRGLVGMFVDRLVKEIESGCVREAILLTNGSTDAKWYHAGLSYASVLCLVLGRIEFLTPNKEQESNNTQLGQSFMYFGTNTESFIEEFSKFGIILIPQREGE